MAVMGSIKFERFFREAAQALAVNRALWFSGASHAAAVTHHDDADIPQPRRTARH